MQNVYIVIHQFYDEIDGEWERCTHIKMVCSSLDKALKYIEKMYPCIDVAHDIPEDYYWYGAFGKIWIQMEIVY